MLTGAVHDLEIFEYSVTEVKKWITGHGRAEKEQVSKMLQMLLGAQDFATADASDALALAVGHALANRGPKESSKSGTSLKALGERLAKTR